MKRIPLIPVLLVVLALVVMPVAHLPAAWADTGDGSLHSPDGGKQAEDAILDPTGSPGDDSDGDPDTAGDGFGYTMDKNPLGNESAGEGPQDRSWLELMLYLLDHCPFLVVGH